MPYSGTMAVMLHLFHGDHVCQSRKELGTWREKYTDREIVNLDGKTATITDLIQATESASLFGTMRLVIVENIFSKQFARKSKEMEKLVAFLKHIPPEIQLIFWEEKELSKNIIRQLPRSADVALFNPQRQIFALVESMRPGNSSQSLELFHRCLKNDSAELVFAMIVRQLRLMIMNKDVGKGIPDLSGWQITKISDQAHFFTSGQLLRLYRKMLEIDIAIKTGNTVYDLTGSLELFLIDISR